MRRELVIDRAGAPTIEVVGNIATDQPDAPTPCVNYSVRQLIDHLLFWAPSLAAAARKETVPPPAVSDIDIDLTDGDWSAKLEADLSRLVTAWTTRPPGKVRLGAPDKVPATMIGGMVCVELVVHGWDLARATDQKPEWEEDVVAFVHRELRTTPIWGGRWARTGPRCRWTTKPRRWLAPSTSAVATLPGPVPHGHPPDDEVALAGLGPAGRASGPLALHWSGRCGPLGGQLRHDPCGGVLRILAATPARQNPRAALSRAPSSPCGVG